jgi:hypothetical protein
MIYSPTRYSRKGMHLFSPKRVASAVLPATTSAVSATASAATSKLGMGTEDTQNSEEGKAGQEEHRIWNDDTTANRNGESIAGNDKSTDSEEASIPDENKHFEEQPGTQEEEEVSDQGTETPKASNGKEIELPKELVENPGEWATNLFYAYARRVRFVNHNSCHFSVRY